VIRAAGRSCVRRLREASATGAEELAPEEGQQVGVELILMRGREAVRRGRIVYFWLFVKSCG